MKDALPENVQQSLDILLNTFIPPTLEILQKDKFLAPVAMKLDKDGEPTFIGLHPENDSDIVDTAKHLEAFRKLLGKHHRDSIAVLLAYDTRINTPGFKDAVAMELEHTNGTQVQLVLPYKFSGLRKKLTTGDIMRVDAVMDRIFS